MSLVSSLLTVASLSRCLAYQRLNEGGLSVMDEIAIPENTKVVTVCAAGRTSQIARGILSI